MSVPTTPQDAQQLVQAISALDASVGQSTQANRVLPQPLPALAIPSRVGTGQPRLL
jgi:hypothetical protein